MSLFTQKMKMLTAVVLDGYVDAVVKALLEEGVMEFVHIADFQADQAARLSSHKEGVPQAAFSDVRSRCENLMKQAGMLLPAIGRKDLDDVGPADLDDFRRRLDKLSSSLSDLRDEQRMLSQKLLAIDELSLYVKDKEEDYLDLRCGTVDKAHLEDFKARMAPLGGILADDGHGALVSLTLKRDSSKVDEVFDRFAWTEKPVSQKEVREVAKAALAKRHDELQAAVDAVSAQVRERILAKKDSLEKMWICLRVNELSGQVESCFSHTKSTTVFSGWVPSAKAPGVEELIVQASHGKCIIEWTEDSEVERSKIPTSVSSARILAPFERMVSNYGTPEYGSINPTPFTAVAYIAMFALMFADLGQGLILLLIGIIGKHYYKTHPMAKDGLISRYLCSLLVFLGPASMFGGLLFGSTFGYSWIPALWFNYHAVVNGGAVQGLVQDVYDILGITIAFGIIVIFTGLVLNWINLVRKKRWLELVFDKNGLVGGLIYALGIRACYYFVDSGYQDFPPWPWLYAGLGFGVLMLFVKGPVTAIWRHRVLGEEEKMGKIVMDTVMDGLVNVLEIFSSFLSNTLSFMRVAGLGIAHVSLMTAFEDMASMTGNIIAEILIMVLGNVLVIALEGLSAGIQSLRLNYYEFFTKYFTGRGIAFKPVGLGGSRS